MREVGAEQGVSLGGEAGEGAGGHSWDCCEFLGVPAAFVVCVLLSSRELNYTSPA